jgi:predicted transglutaminase-like cysteine proteinase
MGKGVIKSGGENGLYLTSILKDVERIEAELARVNARIEKLNEQITKNEDKKATFTSQRNTLANDLNVLIEAFGDDPPGATIEQINTKQAELTAKQAELSNITIEIRRQYLEQFEFEKRKIMLETLRDQGAQDRNIYTADLIEDLPAGATVGTMEMAGDSDGEIVIRPQYFEDGEYTPGRDGKIQSAGASTPSGTYFNLAIYPWWQRWKPIYRVGLIKSIDYRNNRCDICLARERGVQGIEINQPGTYCRVEQEAPEGFKRFCSKNPGHPACVSHEAQTVILTPAIWEALKRVNAEVNSQFRYQSDWGQYSSLENWAEMSKPGDSGDCEDFALTKLRRLLDLGIPAGALRLEIGNHNTGEGHAWLTLETDQGPIGLDTGYIEPRLGSVFPFSGRRRQLTGADWGLEGYTLSDVPIKYMECNAGAFKVGDSVVIEFQGQDWNGPQVVGFNVNPQRCRALVSVVFQSFVENSGAIEKIDFIIDEYERMQAFYERDLTEFYPAERAAKVEQREQYLEYASEAPPGQSIWFYIWYSLYGPAYYTEQAAIMQSQIETIDYFINEYLPALIDYVENTVIDSWNTLKIFLSLPLVDTSRIWFYGGDPKFIKENIPIEGAELVYESTIIGSNEAAPSADQEYFDKLPDSSPIHEFYFEATFSGIKIIAFAFDAKTLVSGAGDLFYMISTDYQLSSYRPLPPEAFFQLNIDGRPMFRYPNVDAFELNQWAILPVGEFKDYPGELLLNNSFRRVPPFYNKDEAPEGTPDVDIWRELPAGFYDDINRRGPWSAGAEYQINDLVLLGAEYFICNYPNIALNPPDNEFYWSPWSDFYGGGQLQTIVMIEAVAEKEVEITAKQAEINTLDAELVSLANQINKIDPFLNPTEYAALVAMYNAKTEEKNQAQAEKNQLIDESRALKLELQELQSLYPFAPLRYPIARVPVLLNLYDIVFRVERKPLDYTP